MAKFFVMPSRESLGKQLRQFLESLFPGLEISRNQDEEFGEILQGLVESSDERFVVFREDLNDDNLAQEIKAQCGAEEGDDIVEVSSLMPIMKDQFKTWMVGEQTEEPIQLFIGSPD